MYLPYKLAGSSTICYAIDGLGEFGDEIRVNRQNNYIGINGTNIVVRAKIRYDKNSPFVSEAEYTSTNSLLTLFGAQGGGFYVKFECTSFSGPYAYFVFWMGG